MAGLIAGSAVAALIYTMLMAVFLKADAENFKLNRVSAAVFMVMGMVVSAVLCFRHPGMVPAALFFGTLMFVAYSDYTQSEVYVLPCIGMLVFGIVASVYVQAPVLVYIVSAVPILIGLTGIYGFGDGLVASAVFLFSGYVAGTDDWAAAMLMFFIFNQVLWLIQLAVECIRKKRMDKSVLKTGMPAVPSMAVSAAAVLAFCSLY